MLDSCALLAWIKGEPEVEVMGVLLNLFEASKAQLVVSCAIFAEVYKPAPEGATWQPQMEAVQRKLRSRDVETVDVSEPIATLAAKYRVEHGMGGMDSLHLATAVRSRCNWLITKDHKFPTQVENLRVWDVHKCAANDLPWMASPEAMQPGLFDEPSNVIKFSPRYDFE
nr:PIN domain-containing protein [Micrococcus luteus]